MGEKCLTSACANRAERRGLCGTCYALYLRAVRGKQITERRAVELGAVMARKRRGRIPGARLWANQFTPTVSVQPSPTPSPLALDLDAPSSNDTAGGGGDHGLPEGGPVSPFG